MIESLLEWSVGLFIASLPLFIAITRSRRRSAGEKKEKNLPREGADLPAGSVKEEGPPRRSLAERFRAFRRRGRYGAKQPMESEPQVPSTGEPTTVRREEESRSYEIGSSSKQPRRRKSGGVERLNSYPPLQRGVLWSEIIGPPKGLR